MDSHSNQAIERDPRAIERDIDHIRHRIGSTVDKLEARLSPNHFIDQAIRSVRAHGGEAAGNLGTMAKQNPLALLMAGASVAWLMRGPGSARSADHSEADGSPSSGGRSDAFHWPTGERRPADDWRERTQPAGGAKRRATHEAVAHDSDSDGEIGNIAHDRFVDARDSIARVLDERPLVVGAIGLAIGAAIGVMAPRTRRADRPVVDAHGL